VVLGFVFQPPRAGGAAPRVGALPAPLTAEKLDVEALPVVEAAGYLGNVAALQANARAGGFFDTALVDADGVVRRMPLLQRFDGALYESLSLATARIAHGAPGVALGVTPGAGGASGLSHIDLGDRSVRVDARGAALIPFRGGVGSFPYVSATDVLNGRTPSELLDGTIVLIGTSAAGLLDIRPTPVAAQYVGVEAHANLIAGLLDGTVRVAPAWARGYEVALLIGWTLLAAFALPRLAPAWAAGLTLASIAGIVAFTLLAWQRAGYVLPLASPLFLVASSATLLLGYGYFVEARRKRRLSRLFGQYVPPEVVTDLDANEAEISLEGESREMSVLFSDVRGFTTLSEGLSPRELTQLMNEMLTPLTAVIQRHRGTIDKYMGDAIMAFWGAPLADPQHARHAVQAALEMVQACAQIRGEFAARGWPEVRIGVGVSSGPMNVGNMGSEFRMAYTVLGDTVNLGSRLEGLTKQYGVEVIVSAATRAAVPEIACRPLDLVRVKGKREPIEIFEPVGERASASSHVLARIESTIAMLAHYRAGRFAAALEVLDALDRDADGPDTLSTLYRERIAWFRAQPPAADWDGVFEHTSK
jgi:adenylate cyclase